MVNLNFLFAIMRDFGFPEEFVEMTQMLFKDASASVKVNGAYTVPFEIGRGVRQGCPLAPYLFLLIAEVMNAMLKKEVAARTVKGIQLPMAGRQQVIAQYADDTSLTLLGEEIPIQGAINTLEIFCLGSGLVLNWAKSCGYWKKADGSPRPAWTDWLGIV
jgi:hypothetical protein